MKKIEPKNDCPPPFQLSRNNSNISSNNNYVKQNKVNNFYQAGYQGFINKNNNMNEHLKINIGITFMN